MIIYRGFRALLASARDRHLGQTHWSSGMNPSTLNFLHFVVERQLLHLGALAFGH
jgi:hypothetical protein